MLKSHSKIILKYLCLISILVGIGGCNITLTKLTTPMPISKKNIPLVFYIIGFNNSKEPVLLEHEIGKRYYRNHYASEKEFRDAQDKNTLWSDECKNNKIYSFYIDAKKREEVEKTLNAVLLLDNSHSVTIKIFDDHPSIKKQKVEIDFWNDDFSYYSIYAVDNRSVALLKYGDSTKSDGFNAFIKGFEYMILFFIIGFIVFGIAVLFESRKQKINI